MVSAGRRENVGVRLFDNMLLERLSHVSPITVAVFWSALSLGLLIGGCLLHAPTTFDLVTALLGGFLGWTLFEYCAHRFLFHLGDWWPPGERLSFIVHGCHHADPSDPTRNVMPLPVSIPAFFAFSAAFMLVLPLYKVSMLFGFIGFSYLSYDLTHYACHQRPMNTRFGRFLKMHHLRHHFRNPNKGFAVTFPLWDRVFGTAE